MRGVAIGLERQNGALENGCLDAVVGQQIEQFEKLQFLSKIGAGIGKIEISELCHFRGRCRVLLQRLQPEIDEGQDAVFHRHPAQIPPVHHVVQKITQVGMHIPIHLDGPEERFLLRGECLFSSHGEMPRATFSSAALSR